MGAPARSLNTDRKKGRDIKINGLYQSFVMVFRQYKIIKLDDFTDNASSLNTEKYPRFNFLHFRQRVSQFT